MLRFEQHEDGIYYVGEPPEEMKISLVFLASCDPQFITTEDNIITIRCKNGVLRYKALGRTEQPGVVYARKVES